MKRLVANLVNDALASLPELQEVAADLSMESTVERTRDASHGDFSTNVAMRLAKAARKSPRDIATSIISALAENDSVEKVEIAGPGFINFYLSPAAFHAQIASILEQGENYGRQAAKSTPKILLEFISANPTGPLHVGHGRLAAYGATIGNLLEASGYTVSREYYVNDAGRQMDILGLSVWLRWQESQGSEVPFPQAGYRGDYIRDIAAAIDTAGIDAPSAEAILDGLPADGVGNDPDEKNASEAYVEALAARAQKLLGAENFDHIRQQSIDSILADIEGDLAGFGVRIDTWFSEQSLTKTGRIDDALAVLKERGILYEKDGATWFPATDFGDEKDRVVIRANGERRQNLFRIRHRLSLRQTRAWLRSFDRHPGRGSSRLCVPCSSRPRSDGLQG